MGVVDRDVISAALTAEGHVAALIVGGGRALGPDPRVQLDRPARVQAGVVAERPELAHGVPVGAGPTSAAARRRGEEIVALAHIGALAAI